MQLDAITVDRLVRAALREDLGADPVSGDPSAGDLTTRASGTGRGPGEARVVAKEAGVLAGLPVARAVFDALAAGVEFEACAADGDRVAVGDVVLRARGPAGALLVGERTALNYLQRLSGIATLTRAFVDAVDGCGARVLDTRKTTPGMRALEKYAVRMGGGDNHRFGLFDQVLLKENHFAMAAPRSYEDVVRQCVGATDRPVIAEARTVDEALAAVRGGAGVVMLDNFAPGAVLLGAVDAVRATAEQIGAAVQIEVSGGIDLSTVRAFADCGVDRISVGQLTHSARSLDLSMLIELRADREVAP